MATASALVLVFLVSDVVSPWPDALYASDFAAFWAGALMVRDGAGPALFDMPTQHAFQLEQRWEHTTDESLRSARGFIPYLNPPPLALLFLPLTFLPMSWAFTLWVAITAVAFVVVIAVVTRGMPNARATAVALLSFAAVGETLASGRLEGGLLLAFTMGVLALRANRPVLGGAWLGLLWLKPQYAALFPLVFLIKGRYRELAGMAASSLALLAVSVAVVGIDGFIRYLDVLSRISALHSPLAAGTKPAIMINWRALLLGHQTVIPEETAATMVPILGAVTVLVSLLAWRGPWRPDSPRFARQLLVTAVATFLAGPHGHYQGMVLLLTPLALALREPMPAAPLNWAWRPMLALGWLLAMGVWLFLDSRWLLAPYFLVAMGVLTWQCWDSGGTRGVSGGRQGRSLGRREEPTASPASLKTPRDPRRPPETP